MKIGKQQSKIVMRQLPENYARHSFVLIGIGIDENNTMQIKSVFQLKTIGATVSIGL